MTNPTRCRWPRSKANFQICRSSPTLVTRGSCWKRADVKFVFIIQIRPSTRLSLQSPRARKIICEGIQAGFLQNLTIPVHYCRISGFIKCLSGPLSAPLQGSDRRSISSDTNSSSRLLKESKILSVEIARFELAASPNHA